MAGMVAASLVTGNTVVLKPAADSPTIAAKFIDILFEAGVPKEAVQLHHRPRQRHWRRAGAASEDAVHRFTGSKEVGLRISELAAKAAPGQIWIKRTVLEMGGKDAIVVDDEADIDAAVEGTAQAAFGYQGQKCSACSRAIVSEKIYDTFVQKLVERTKKITRRPERRSEQLHGAGHQPVRDENHSRLHRSRQEGRQAAHRRQDAPRATATLSSPRLLRTWIPRRASRRKKFLAPSSP